MFVSALRVTSGGSRFFFVSERWFELRGESEYIMGRF